MPSTEITSCEHFDDLLADTNNTKKYIVVDFYGKNCGPCIAFAPTFEQLSDQYSKTVHFLKINVHNHEVSDIPSEYRISALPTFMFFKVGSTKELTNSTGTTKHVGAPLAKEVIQSTLNSYLPTASLEPTSEPTSLVDTLSEPAASLETASPVDTAPTTSSEPTMNISEDF
ncbi:MAG: hypothetical protein Homavirus4_17 [Homavirus sp.]|uniref:Thioredoxin domain-containing protein n=1 Tax=Homavirus sp. TaxID=2487769 RepID=A0A3G5A6E1_9VIRU|nr:MAG: hypothetical protein Homavirus4_17 [Homavirus sp.]